LGIIDKQIGNYKCLNNCRFCEGESLVNILDFGPVPLAGGFLKEKDFQNEKYYPLDLNFCKDCFLVQTSNVVSGETLFQNDYFFFSSAIKTLVAHFSDFANELNNNNFQGINNPSVLEIGCNDGVLLKPLSKLGIKCIGVDPATNVIKSLINAENFTIINDFFSEQLATTLKVKHGKVDAILSSFSFAHIDDMIDVMKGIKIMLKKDGVFVFEIYYLGTLIEEMQYDMIYHEHMSYYSLKTLRIFLKKFNMEIFDAKFISEVRSGCVRFYARNIRERTAEIAPIVMEMIKREESNGYDDYKIYSDYAQKVSNTKSQLLKLLQTLKNEGKSIIGYGASGRGTTIMNYCGIDKRYLDYVVDDAPAKHGYFTPGTHLKIKPWEFIHDTPPPDYIVLFAWAFTKEVIKKRKDYIAKGGKFIIPLPEVKIVEK
jgi:methylation protein EvaC